MLIHNQMCLLLIYNQMYTHRCKHVCDWAGSTVAGSPAGNAGKDRPSVCTGHGGVAWLGVPDHQSLSLLKEEPPSEVDKRPQSWASFSFPRTAQGAPGWLLLQIPAKYTYRHPSTPSSRLNSPTQTLISTSTSPLPSAPSTIMSSFSRGPPPISPGI